MTGADTSESNKRNDIQFKEDEQQPKKMYPLLHPSRYCLETLKGLKLLKGFIGAGIV